ncbi:general substrate transporter [Naematelia encephala]|uniref:General substrate transporter n=1 Tax=Naematelia encephala TaxID=71784 RepID=A0A1Y2AY01_9TREE|nr:general substrate transporter [Naematelia encephala]
MTAPIEPEVFAFNQGADPLESKTQLQYIENIDAENKDTAVGDKVFSEILVSEYDLLSRSAVIRKCWMALMFAFMVSFGAIFDGYHNTLPANIIANQGFINTMGTVKDPVTGAPVLNALYISAWGGTSNGVNAVSCILGGFVSDWMGRKFNMLCMTGFLMIATIIEMVAKNWKVWLASKVFAAFGNGFSQSVLLTYISEVSPKQIRGGLCTSYAVILGLGQLFASVALEILEQTKWKLDWRRVIYTEWILTGMFLIFWFFIPESPWYYANKDLHDKAKHSLKRLHANIKDYDVEREYAVLRSEIDAAEALRAIQKETKWTELFKGVNGRRTLISCFPPMFYNVVGSTIMFGYTTYFFQLAGLSDPFLGSLILILSLIITEAIAFYTTDQIGRRPLALGACLFFGLSLGAIGILGCFPITTTTSNALLGMAIIWVVAYGSGFAPTMQTFVSETSTPRLRAKTLAVAQGSGQAFGLIWSYCTPLMLSDQQANWGVKTAFFFSGTSFLGLFFYYFFMPELKGRTYGELDELFQKRIPARKFGTAKTQAQVQIEMTENVGV